MMKIMMIVIIVLIIIVISYNYYNVNKLIIIIIITIKITIRILCNSLRENNNSLVMFLTWLTTYNAFIIPVLSFTILLVIIM